MLVEGDPGHPPVDGTKSERLNTQRRNALLTKSSCCTAAMEYQNVPAANAAITPPVKRLRVKKGFRARLRDGDIPCRMEHLDQTNAMIGIVWYAHIPRDGKRLEPLFEKLTLPGYARITRWSLNLGRTECGSRRMA